MSSTPSIAKGRFTAWLDQLNPYDPDKLERDGVKPIRVEEAQSKRTLTRIVVVSFVLFMGWALFAPLDAGVSVSGTVVVQGNRKAVQHPAGGVVTELLVREGDVVQQGDVLLKINPLTTEANLSGAELDYINALATESRLQAEREGSPAITWLADLQAYGGTEPRVSEAKALQVKLFQSRRSEYGDQQRIYQEQLVGLQAQLRELQSVLALRKEQLGVISEEATSNRELATQGFIPRSKANEVERTRSEMLSSLSNVTAEIAKIQSGIAATRLQLTQHQSTFRKEVDAQLADVQKNRKAGRGKVEALQFDLSLAEIKAPVSGTVVALKANTVGGVIQSGQLLMEIVPRDGRLIVEAQVPPQSIDKVHEGLPADMRFSAFNLNTTPVIPGKVILVGADKIPGTSPQQGDYYLAQVETTAEGVKLLGDKVVQPGMPVEVIVKTGERSFFSYLIKPLTDRFARSFKD
ncbi:MAG: HlyD family type I secretion periplasmic adaptor subunit [Hylemonella sp.]|nr:HlyD family type I secretion periplasmic adaptor subunit [Hylemonella sp.]